MKWSPRPSTQGPPTAPCPATRQASTERAASGHCGPPGRDGSSSEGARTVQPASNTAARADSKRALRSEGPSSRDDAPLPPPPSPPSRALPLKTAGPGCLGRSPSLRIFMLSWRRVCGPRWGVEKEEMDMAQRGGAAKVTTDHEFIRHWVEERGGCPAAVKRTSRARQPGIIRIDYPGYSGETSLAPITWDEFFEKFEEAGLAFLYQEERSGGGESRFSKLVKREEKRARRSPARARKAAAGAGAARAAATGAASGRRRPRPRRRARRAARPRAAHAPRPAGAPPPSRAPPRPHARRGPAPPGRPSGAGAQWAGPPRPRRRAPREGAGVAPSAPECRALRGGCLGRASGSCCRVRDGSAFHPHRRRPAEQPQGDLGPRAHRRGHGDHRRRGRR